MFNEEQRAAFDCIVSSISNGTHTMFFIDGPAGTGKSFLYNTLILYLKNEGKKLIVVASSGVAA